MHCSLRNIHRFTAHLLLLIVSVVANAIAANATPAPVQTPPLPLPRRSIMFFEPWQSTNNSVAMSQNYYDMPIQRATSTDPIENLRAELLLAATYGCDTFATTIATKSNWAYAENFTWMLRAAEGTDLKIIPSFVGISDTETHLKHALALFGKWGNHPNWLRVDNKLVWSTFWADQQAPAAAYLQLREKFAAAGYETFIVGDPNSHWSTPVTAAHIANWKNIFDLIYNFGELGRGGNQSSADAYRAMSDASRTNTRTRAWMAGIDPGYLGGWYNGRNDYYTPFRNLDQWLGAWETALAANPDWLQWISWNDKDETHLQPTLFQWETLLEIGANYARIWNKTNNTPDIPPSPSTTSPASTETTTPVTTAEPGPPINRLYAAYPREQLVGTLQRIELIALPDLSTPASSTQQNPKNVPITLTGELRTPDGRTLAILPARTLNPAATAPNAARTDWSIDTTHLAETTPVIIPILRIQNTPYTLPSITLRSGWLENQNILKIPLRRAATTDAARAQLTLDTTTRPQIVHARLAHAIAEPLARATLFRNDHRMGDLLPTAPASTSATATAKPTLQFLINCRTPLWFRMNIDSAAVGEIRLARRSVTTGNPVLTYTAQRLSGFANHGFTIAVELALADDALSSAKATLDFTTPNGATLGHLRIADLIAADGAPLPVADTGLTLRTIWADALADERPPLPVHLAPSTPLALAIANTAHRPGDAWHARLETISGKIIETNRCFPSLPSLPEPASITVIQSPFTNDLPKISDYITPPPITRATTVVTRVHPAVLQTSAWTFANPANLGADTAGRHPLTLGRGTDFLARDTNRIPTHHPSGGPGNAAFLEFDGIDDRAQLTVQNEPKGPFTMTFDIQPQGTPSTTQYILADENASTDTTASPIEITRLADGRLRAGRRNVTFVTSPEPLPSDVWTHVEVRFTGNRLTLHLNNSEVASTTANPAFRRFGNSRVYLGGAKNPLQGCLANVTLSGFAPNP
ncbi:laminin G domain-containing protein [Opitutaceae bacterium TAV1]|nr:laminin G domain-containing protein [Opitutaceae bacterium TAV1]